MAYIDKTFVSSFKEYNAIREWSKTAYIKYLDGEVGKHPMYDWLYYPYLTEKDFTNGKEYTLWNTDYEEDVWLVKNCPFLSVQDRLHEQYKSDFDSLLNPVIKHDYSKLSKHLKAYCNKKYFSRVKNLNNMWLIEVHEPKWWFNTEYNKVISLDDPLHSNTNMLIIRANSFKALIRKLRKIKIIKGLTFLIENRRYNFNFYVKAKK